MGKQGEGDIGDLSRFILLFQNEELTRANVHKFFLVVKASRLSKELGKVNDATSTII
jgi:hypothetical protein